MVYKEIKEEDVINNFSVTLYPNFSNDSVYGEQIAVYHVMDNEKNIDDRNKENLYIAKETFKDDYDVYRLSFNEDDEVNISLITVNEAKKQFEGKTNDKYYLSVKEFKLKEIPKKVEKSLKESDRFIENKWLPKRIQRETKLVETLLNILETNETVYFTEDHRKFNITVDWLSNSPYVKDVYKQGTNFQEFRLINDLEDKDDVVGIMDKITDKRDLRESIYHTLKMFKEDSLNNYLTVSNEEVRMITIEGDTVYIKPFNDNTITEMDLDLYRALINGNNLVVLSSLSESYINKLGRSNYENFSEFAQDLINENTNYIINEEEFNNTKLLTEATENIALRKKIMTKIEKVYENLDRTGLNLEFVKKQWDGLTDKQFFKEMKAFVNDPKKNFTLEVLPGKNEPTLSEIRNALKAIDVPENEFVYFRHLEGTEKDPVRTRYKVPVGYIHIKRLQQILSKKNTYSLDINSRNIKTGQVTGASKISNISDLESSALKAINADAALKEFLSARADDMGSKQQMYNDISNYGYTNLKDMPDSVDDKKMINTIHSYLIAGGVNSDIKISPEVSDFLKRMEA